MPAGRLEDNGSVSMNRTFKRSPWGNSHSPIGFLFIQWYIRGESMENMNMKTMHRSFFSVLTGLSAGTLFLLSSCPSPSTTPPPPLRLHVKPPHRTSA